MNHPHTSCGRPVAAWFLRMRSRSTIVKEKQMRKRSVLAEHLQFKIEEARVDLFVFPIL